MHQHNRPRLRRDRAPKSLRLDLPSVVIYQRRSLDPHIIQHCQKIKQRISRLRHDNLLPRIAQQLEQKAVRLARARRQHHPLRRNCHAMIRVVAAHRLARPQQPQRLRIVIPALPHP